MLNIPPEILTSYVAFLEKRTFPATHYNDYKKWLRYYLDYCGKYGFPISGSKSLTQFLGKLKEKKQTELQVKQAGRAITLFFMTFTALLTRHHFSPDSYKQTRLRKRQPPALLANATGT